MVQPLGGPQDYDVPNHAEKLAAKRIGFDKACRWVPLAATVNSLVDLYQKHSYKKMQAVGVELDAYQKRIVNQKDWKLYVLLLPVVGQLVVGIHNLVRKSGGDEEGKLQELDEFQAFIKDYHDKEPRIKFNISEATNGGYGDSVTERNYNDFVKMADEGDVEAQYSLGLYCIRNKEHYQGREWLEKAAEKGHLGAKEQIRKNSVK